ncbi:MAG: ABC transporter ATP-binding protein/permease [Lachnospiraceae bacterium]|nr:ABC transporter ATP-binding protein/permease [Lachnospiraceae bacterium]
MLEDKKKEKGPGLVFMTRKTLQYVLKVAWQEKKVIYLFYILRFLGSALSELKVLLLPKLLIDEIVAIKDGASVEDHLKTVALYVGLTVIAEFLSRFFSNVANSYINWANTFFDRTLYQKACEKSMTMDFQYTEDPKVLDQQQKAMEGISWYSGGVVGVLNCFYEIVYNFVLMGTVITIISFYCPLLIPVQILAMGLVCWYNVKNQKIEVEFFLKLAKSNRLFSYFFWELPTYRHGQDTRLYDGADMFLERGAAFEDEQIVLWAEQSHLERKNTYKSNIANAVRDGLSYFYMGYKGIKGLISIAEFTMCASAASRLYQSLIGIGGNLQSLTQKCSYAYQFLLYLDYPDALKKGSRAVEGEKHVIEFEHVYFKYPRSEEYVLEDINIKINSGEHLSVVGLNGAGKTTFIKLLCRLYDVTEGRILVDGVDIREYSEKEYRRLFSVVFQDFKLFAFSLKDNVEMGDTEKEYDEAYFEETLKLSGLYEDAKELKNGYDTRLFKSFDEDGTELSGGQQQKTAISRALYRNAPIVILDEPTAALDPLAEYEIYKKFDTLVGGKSAIYISHRLSSCKFCDRIAVFSDKTIKEYGTHEELVHLEDGVYARMFAAQAKYYVDAAS